MQDQSFAQVERVTHLKPVEKHVDVTLIGWVTKDQALRAVQQVKFTVWLVPLFAEQALERSAFSCAPDHVDIFIRTTEIGMTRRRAEMEHCDAAKQTQAETGAFRRSNDVSGVVVEGVRHMERCPVAT